MNSLQRPSILPLICSGFLLAASLGLVACGAANRTAAELRPPRAQKWFLRAQGEFAEVRVDEARDSAQRALDLVPTDEAVRLLAAQIALAKLEFDETIRLLRGVRSSQASSLRGRAYWYKGDPEKAADALEQLLTDPEVKDPWAKSITQLARRGMGRQPFTVSITEGHVTSVELARVPLSAPYYVVPIELDGESALAMIATGTAEVMVDSATRRDPSWISLRFGRRFEVNDVPALTQDLSGLSRQLGAPIKALLGINLLRRLNATMDLRGRQFVVRDFAPPAPPVASRLSPYYLRGGGMVVAGALGTADERAALFVDSSMGFPIALDLGGWKKLGVAAQSLTKTDKLGGVGSELRQGSVSLLRLGAFKIPELDGVYYPPIDQVQKQLKIDVDGAVGAGLLSSFRITFTDGGRVLWLEQPSSLRWSDSSGVSSAPTQPPRSIGPPASLVPGKGGGTP